MVLVVVVIAAVSFVPRFVAAAIDEVVDPAPFWRVRFEVLAATPKGMHFIQLHDSNGYEIVQIIKNHSDMYLKSVNVLAEWKPNMEAFVNGRGDAVVVTESQVRSVTDYLDAISQYSSSALKAVIDEERTATPLEGTVGMTMNEAWRYLNQDPRFPYQMEDIPVNPNTPSAQGSLLWELPEYQGYAIYFDPNTWELSQWNNGISSSWQLKNKELPSCVITAPRQVLDPFTYKHDFTQRLGDVEFSVQAAGIAEFNQYTLYRPTGMPNFDAQAGTISLIVYPEALNREQCRAQSEVVLATLYRWNVLGSPTPTPSDSP
jgi:hypothetical protein